MKNLKIRFIKVGDKYNMQFKRFGFWMYAMIPVGGSHMESLIYGKASSITKSKCLNRYLYSKDLAKQNVSITEYPTIKIY
tara:strand:+ start:3220 stop:3459 length:240 start_codon:yes stop_codon:yes gene_type:complete